MELKQLIQLRFLHLLSRLQLLLRLQLWRESYLPQLWLKMR
nr:MAG TPA: hypothetical protein [Caudoviricetes sp.]